MARPPMPLLPKAGPIQGTETTIVSQDGVPRRLEIGAVLKAHEQRLAALEKAPSDQAARDTAQDAALAQEAAARASADGSAGTRMKALEDRPEEVAHFTATKALPTIALGASITLSLTGLVPARAGDVVRAGESVDAQPRVALPAGLNVAAVSAPADGRVDVQLTAGLAITGGAAVVWDVVVLR